MKVKRLIIRIDEEKCDGCGLCVPACPEGALQIVDGKAKLVSESLCDGLGACIGECPQGAITMEEREAEPFDESLVAVHAHSESTTPTPVHPPVAVCPSMQATSWQGEAHASMKSSEQATDASHAPEPASALTHWPVQLTLLSPLAPFLKDADLLLAADCVPFAYPAFHQRLLNGKVLAIACPKLDDAQAHMEKLTAIFQQARPRTITIAHMEVPCCYGLVMLAERALAKANMDIPIQRIVVSVYGELLEDETSNR